jgi:hypothetical protein
MLLRKGNQMSKFKPGDWVVKTTTDDYYDGIRNWFQLKETDLIFKQEVNAAEWEANFYFVNAHEIWRPEHKEWCWHTRTRQLVQVDLKSACLYDAIGHTMNGHPHNIKYSECEPFIGQLPSFLKEIK